MDVPHLDKHDGRDPGRTVQHQRAVGAGRVPGWLQRAHPRAYTLDLRQYVTWCTEHHLAVFGARGADIECFARHLECLGRAQATIARRQGTVSCLYRYAEQEGRPGKPGRPQRALCAPHASPRTSSAD